MAIKVQRTHGLRATMEKCGCKATQEYEDSSLLNKIEDTTIYTPCQKHKISAEAAETFKEVLLEVLETAQMQARKFPDPSVTPSKSIGHSIEDVAAAQSSGAVSATRTPINRSGSGSRLSVRRSSDSGSLPRVSTAVRNARASGSATSIDAELARTPDFATPGRIGPISREKVQEAIDEAAESGEPVTPLDVILSVNDE
jgi:hypothetical protein